MAWNGLYLDSFGNSVYLKTKYESSVPSIMLTHTVELSQCQCREYILKKLWKKCCTLAHFIKAIYKMGKTK